MKSIEWIDRVIEARQLPSDRQAALLIGITAATMSRHRTGQLVTLDDESAFSVEDILGLPHGSVVADQHGEREKDPEIRKMWHQMVKLVAQSAAIVLATICLALPEKSEAAQLDAVSKIREFSILC